MYESHSLAVRDFFELVVEKVAMLFSMFLKASVSLKFSKSSFVIPFSIAFR